MLVFLQIVGGIVVFIILVVLLFYVYFRIKMGKYYGMDAANELCPLHIHLNEDLAPEWVQKKAAKKIADELLELGFVRGKTYSIYEMNDYEMNSFFKPPFTAVMYNHPVAGNWVDIVAETDDGKMITLSNAPMGDSINMRPGNEKHFIPDDSPSGLFEKIQQSLQGRHCIELDAVQFREYFENEYKKDMLWRHRNGGASLEEFVDTAKLAGKKFSEKNIREAFVEFKENELSQWHEAALREYRERENIAEDDYENIEYGLFIVPAKTDPAAFISYLSQTGFVDYDSQEKLMTAYEDEEDVPALFEKINQALSPELRAKKYAEIDYPIAITIYKISENMLQDYYGK